MCLITRFCFWRPLEILNNIILQNKYYCIINLYFPTQFSRSTDGNSVVYSWDPIATNRPITRVRKKNFFEQLLMGWICEIWLSDRGQSIVFNPTPIKKRVVNIYFPFFYTAVLRNFCCSRQQATSEMSNLWRAERFAWHTAFTVVPPFFLTSFAQPASLHCAWGLHMNYRCYQIIPRVRHLHKSGAVRSSDWIFIIGAPSWR